MESRQLIVENVRHQAEINDTSIQFSYNISYSPAALTHAMQRANHGVAVLRESSISVTLGSASDAIDTFKPVMNILLKNVETLMNVVDGIAQVCGKLCVYILVGVSSTFTDSSVRTCSLDRIIDSTQGQYFILEIHWEILTVKHSCCWVKLSATVAYIASSTPCLRSSTLLRSLIGSRPLKLGRIH